MRVEPNGRIRMQRALWRLDIHLLMLFSLDIPGVGIKGREMSEAGCHERYSKDIRIAEPSYLLSASTLSGEQRS